MSIFKLHASLSESTDLTERVSGSRSTKASRTSHGVGSRGLPMPVKPAISEFSNVSGRSAKSQVRAMSSSKGKKFFGGQRRAALDAKAIRQMSQDDEEEMGTARRYVHNLLASQSFETGVGIIIIVNFFILVWETDARAKLYNAPDSGAEHDGAKAEVQIAGQLNSAFLVFYIWESSIRLFAQRLKFFHSNWNLFDLFIVVMGLLDELARMFLEENSAMENVQVLRSMRLLRLLRATRIITSFQELYSLACGLANCMRTLMWAACLVTLTLTIYSIVAVEYLNPLMEELAKAGNYDSCDWCPHAFASIMSANLSFFQIITGDGWSRLGRPLIEKHWWTAAIFILVIFTVVFGLLNLVTAVIVESLSQGRELDIIALAARKAQERQTAWECFTGLCIELDKDRSGDISLDELKEGLEEIPELQAYLSIMGVEEDDLKDVFDILDQDGDGSVTHSEFSHQLYKMKTQEVRTVVSFIKYSVDQLRAYVKIAIEGDENEGGTQNLESSGIDTGTKSNPNSRRLDKGKSAQFAATRRVMNQMNQSTHNERDMLAQTLQDEELFIAQSRVNSLAPPSSRPGSADWRQKHVDDETFPGIPKCPSTPTLESRMKRVDDDDAIPGIPTKDQSQESERCGKARCNPDLDADPGSNDKQNGHAQMQSSRRKPELDADPAITKAQKKKEHGHSMELNTGLAMPVDQGKIRTFTDPDPDSSILILDSAHRSKNHLVALEPNELATKPQDPANQQIKTDPASAPDKSDAQLEKVANQQKKTDPDCEAEKLCSNMNNGDGSINMELV